MDSRYRPFLLLIVAVSLFGVMDGIGKLLATDYSVLQLLWARFAFAVPVVLATSAPSAWITLLRCERPVLQALRALLPVIASAAILLGLTMLPLADVTAITFAAPLFVVALSPVVLGERVTPAAWISVGIGFLGVLIVVRPGAGAFAWAALFPLASAFIFGLYQVLTRLVSAGDPPGTTLAWTIVVGFVLTTPLVPFDWSAGSASGWLLLIVSGLLFGMSHWLLIRAFALAPASILTPFTYSQMVAAVVIGVLVFGDVPDIWTIAGTVLIVLAGIYVMRRTSLPAEDQGITPA